ncbi:hypothetical protein EFA46_002970 [Halarchaeum sp. CBA1220]|uniref:hypothetical protein n=1 Tax=Halarchaeum sp. CBA1220 TaxID=1853682 RepID=UPI000F3A8796|nr:hypothetical protein [Halarchaeum sp. CBA1220]QLC33212.1 hypothetical protein EFA46_002970 [Halarchaeum sp. CBA1220]
MRNEGVAVVNVEFERFDGGVRIHDRIESVTYTVETGSDTVLEADTDAFQLPVTHTFAVETDHLSLPNLTDVYVRDSAGVALDLPPGQRDGVGTGTYEIEISATPVKLYLHVEDAAVVVDSLRDATTIEFDRTARVAIGVRSLHEHPAGSVTVRDDPRDLMRAVSTFGSALKTTSAERSFPTMRGHPPIIERGERFAVPPNVRPPDTGVRIEVPARYESVYSVATLAYYLGADVVPSATPRVVAAGRTFDLPEDELSDAANDVLRHCFTLDCVVRTEGIYPIDLAEREDVLTRVDLDLADLYDAPLDERTAAYLDVPCETTKGILEWHLTTDIEPTPDHAEILPYVVNDLSFIRSPSPSAGSGPPVPEPDSVSEFFRNDPDGASVRSTDETGTRATDSDSAPSDHIVSPAAADTVGHAWVGDGYPRGASKPTVDSYRRRLDRETTEDTAIDVHVVCNDPEMREEAEKLYGFRDLIEFDVETDFDLTIAETRDVLASETDLLHYIGHVTEEGMQCRDGDLDVRTLDDVNVDTFVLNGCRSYAQGMALVDAGALGGVVTVDNVFNRVATDVGRSVARLLDNGFDLHGALDVATENVTAGYQYTIVGNGGVTLCHHHMGCPTLGLINTDDVTEESLLFSVRCYLTRDVGPGTFISLIPLESQTRHLANPMEHSFELGPEHLQKTLSSGRSPILVDGELRWSDELELADVYGP